MARPPKLTQKMIPVICEMKYKYGFRDKHIAAHLGVLPQTFTQWKQRGEEDRASKKKVCTQNLLNQWMSWKVTNLLTSLNGYGT